MTQNDLNRAVARATGESVSTVKRLGFLIDEGTADVENPGFAHTDPRVIDWDQLQAQRSSLPVWRPCRTPALA